MPGEWLDNDYFLPNCTQGHAPAHYSNWGSLTLGFAVTKPDGYDYDTTLGKFILPFFGMTQPVTNTCIDTSCVPGYAAGGGRVRPSASAHGIRSSIAEMTNFVGNYLYYWIAPNFVLLSDNTPTYWVTTALRPPIPGVAWGLDWGINDKFSVPPQKTTYTLCDKNGMSGAQGFSSYVGMINTVNAPYGSVIQVGVLVLVNMAMKGVKPNPVDFGKGILRYLLGGEVPSQGYKPVASDDDEELDDADPVDPV
ncbi:MAG TPA: serine hydrolase [Stellaceae bacterium]|jgi:CubicO group peptidase (beta-lactamase class C family)